ncbi:MAG: glycosyltransferase [Magnetococcales bacterium]|nr:glycosyltransferase [Magnetococcales bacterium]
MNAVTSDSEPLPRVTVLTSVYNGARYLDDAIASILAQTWTDFELLLIDDASTDATPVILAAWAGRDPRIRLVRNVENLGLTRSLNKGIVLARGVWIARQDADDRSLPDRLARQMAFLETHPDIGLLGSAAWILQADGQRASESRRVPSTHLPIAWNLLFANPFFHASMIFRRDLVLANPYDETVRHGQDFELWGRLVSQTRAANLTEPLIELRHHEERISVRHHENQQAIGMTIVRRRLEDLCPDICWDEATLSAVRDLIHSEWPNQGETADIYLIWLRLLERFAQGMAHDPDRAEMMRVEERVLRRCWRAVAGMTMADRWALLRTMGRVAGWRSVIVLARMALGLVKPHPI